jgi:hypothetical protein
MIQLIFRVVQFIGILVHKPDETRRPIFTVNLGITALQALPAQIIIVLHAFIVGFSFRMLDTLSHDA